MSKIKDSFSTIAQEFDEVELLTEKQAPHGLMEKARTISWLIEQIYVQNLVEHASDIGLEKVEYPDDDLIIYDVQINVPGDSTTYYVNVKTGLVSSSSNKNDLSKASKIIRFFNEHADEEFAVLAVNVKVRFKGSERTIDLDENEITVDNVAWINSEDIYVNPSNRNLQCSLNKLAEIRSNEEFISELLFSDKGIIDAIERRGAQIPMGIDDLGFDYKQYDPKSDSQ